MLEPDPKSRWTIEEVMAFPWLQTVQVCHTAEKPTHIHVYAKQLAEQQVQAARDRERELFQ